MGRWLVICCLLLGGAKAALAGWAFPNGSEVVARDGGGGRGWQMFYRMPNKRQELRYLFEGKIVEIHDVVQGRKQVGKPYLIFGGTAYYGERRVHTLYAFDESGSHVEIPLSEPLDKIGMGVIHREEGLDRYLLLSVTYHGAGDGETFVVVTRRRFEMAEPDTTLYRVFPFPVNVLRDEVTSHRDLHIRVENQDGVHEASMKEIRRSYSVSRCPTSIVHVVDEKSIVWTIK